MSGEEMHERFAADAAAYVLGSLTEPEHQAFVAHLAGCPQCRDEVASLQLVVSVLPAAVPQLASTPELKGRVMATVRSEAGLREPRRDAAGEGPAVGGLRARRAVAAALGLGRARLLGSLGAASALVVVVVAIVLSGSGGGSATRTIRAQVTLPSASVSVRVSGGHAELDVAHMPQSPLNHVYEVWVKRGGAPEPTDALFTVSSAGSATVGVPGSLKGVKAILVTAEPSGGSLVPTSKPVIVASL